MQQQLQSTLAAADAASHVAAQHASTSATLEEQLRTHASDANDLLSVMNGMRETLSQQQLAISKLVAKRARAEERSAAADERCKEADARAEQQSQLVRQLQTQLKDAAICVQLHQAVSDRNGSEASSIQAALQQKINDLNELHRTKLQEAEQVASALRERLQNETDALRSAHALQQQQLQMTHERNLKVLQANLEEAQQRSVQLTEDLDHAQADSIDLLQKCDLLRNAMSEEAAAFRSKLSLAAAAASQSHSQMVAAQEARAVCETAIADVLADNKLQMSQIQELSTTIASMRAELEHQQQITADTLSSSRSASIAQHIAESELQLEKEATNLHRSRADSAEKLLEESARMRADVQVVLAAAADELADALENLHCDDCDASVACLACRALLCMLRHTRPVLVDSNRIDTAIAALESIYSAAASHAGKKIAAMANAAADAMREADELRGRCGHQQQQLQDFLAQSLEAAAFKEQLQQMHARIDSMTESLEEEHCRCQAVIEENKNLDFLCSKTAAEVVCAQQQRDELAAEMQRMQHALQDLQTKFDLSLQETTTATTAAATAAALAASLRAERDAAIVDSQRLAANVENAEIRLKEEESSACVQLERLQQQLDAAQRSAALETNGLAAAVAEANGRAADACERLSNLQLEISEEKRKVIEEKDSAAATIAQLEGDHAQLLRDCELLHAYQSETLQELKQLQSMYDQLLAERDEAEATAATHVEELEQRLQEVSEAAAAAESERVQLLQHLHLSQEENMQLHRQQQVDERQKISLQCAVNAQNELAQQEVAGKMKQLKVPTLRRAAAFLLFCRTHGHRVQEEIASLHEANTLLMRLNSDAGAACLQLQEVATRDEATIQELQQLLEEQQRQQADAGATMAAAEQQLQQLSQRTLQLGQDVAMRQGQVDELQVSLVLLYHFSNVYSFYFD